jgi:hypothetical protein
MSKYKSLMDSSQISEGDIIQFATQGDAVKRRGRPLSSGYVHSIVYDPKNKDSITHFAVLEIVPAKEAELSLNHPIKTDEVGDDLGLPANQKLAVILFPLKVSVDKEGLGRRDGLVQRIGTMRYSSEQTRLQNRIENIGGDDRLFFGRDFGPRMARPKEDAWGVHIPRGVVRRNEETEWVEPKAKKKHAPKHDSVGKELDVVGLDKLVDAGILDQETAELFQNPRDKRVKPITNLRGIWKMADKNLEELEKYVPVQAGLSTDVKLEDIGKSIEDEVHPTVVWGLSSPRDPKKGQEKAPVITTLSQAYELVTQKPEDLKKYNYLGPKMQEYAVEHITKAYESRAQNMGSPNWKIDETAQKIKSIWQSLAGTYAGHQPDPRFIQNGTPIWEMVPKQP